MRYGYARVSRDDQHPEQQETELSAAGAEQVFTDKGVSGSRSSRPALDEMLSRLQPGDTVMIVRLDRLGRSVQHLLELSALLESRNVSLVCTQQGFDTRTAMGRMLFVILGAVAEFEKTLLIERTKDGLARARAEGRTGGAKPKLTPVQAAEVRKLFADGRSVHDITELFPVSRATVYRLVQGEPAA